MGQGGCRAGGLHSANVKGWKLKRAQRPVPDQGLRRFQSRRQSRNRLRARIEDHLLILHIVDFTGPMRGVGRKGLCHDNV